VAVSAHESSTAESSPPHITPDARELMGGLLSDADLLAERDTASPRDIDLCMRLGAGHSAGPFQLRQAGTIASPHRAEAGQAAAKVSESWTGPVGLAGTGHTAAGIAEAVPRSGREVRVLGHSAGAQRLHEVVAASLARQVSRGRLDEPTSQAVRARRHPVGNAAQLGEVGVVIEAVAEDREVTLSVRRDLNDQLHHTVPIATNTSSYRVSDLRASLSPGRPVLALHFFNPAAVMKLVEVVVPEDVSAQNPSLEERAHAWVRALSKTPVRCGDSRGLVVNRLLIPFLKDAMAAHATGRPAEEVDAPLVEGAHHPMCPPALIDLIGIDVTVAALESMSEAEPESRLRPHPLLTRMAAAGELGRKSRRGFYDYRCLSRTPRRRLHAGSGPGGAAPGRSRRPQRPPAPHDTSSSPLELTSSQQPRGRHDRPVGSDHHASRTGRHRRGMGAPPARRGED
jgi:3-hydroxybutyryl-CoA dehydrogenase